MNLGDMKEYPQHVHVSWVEVTDTFVSLDKRCLSFVKEEATLSVTELVGAKWWHRTDRINI